MISILYSRNTYCQKSYDNEVLLMQTVSELQVGEVEK